jgi:hypothetical protein
MNSELDDLSLQFEEWLKLVIVCPVLEELLFRYLLPSHLSWVIHDSMMLTIICSFLFGLYHIQNLLLFKSINWKNSGAVLRQIIMSFFIGLHLHLTNSLIMSIMLHSQHNFMVMIVIVFKHLTRDEITTENDKSSSEEETDSEEDYLSALRTAWISSHSFRNPYVIARSKSSSYLSK